MPAAADQEWMGHDPDSDIRSTGPADHRYPPMQCQQWHVVVDPHNNPNGERATIYSDDERIVCQTHGTWSKGPSNDERPHVLSLIAEAPDLRLALFNLEALVTAVLSTGQWPEGASPNNLPPQVIAARQTLKATQP
jgi:hypothetical protein